VSAMLTRQVDFLKGRCVTALFTSLAAEGQEEPSAQLVASLIDTCLLLRTLEGNGEHNRVVSVLKSRGMSHSNQVREFLLTDRGIELADVYVGPQGVLTGSARSAQEAKERTDATERLEDLQLRRSNLERQRESVEAQVASLWREFEDESNLVDGLLSRGTSGREEGAEQRLEQGRLRNSDPLVTPGAPGRGGPGPAA
jgi:circadian clock protein KaiC